MSSGTRRPLTEEEYLLIERRAPERSEYFDGDVFAVPGASLRQNSIVVNIATALHAQLRGGPCRVLVNDQRVRAGLGGSIPIRTSWSCAASRSSWMRSSTRS